MVLTTNDIQGLIGLAIVNNREAVVQSLLAKNIITQDQVDKGISDEELFQKMSSVYFTDGVTAIKSILSSIPLREDKLTDEQKDLLAKRFLAETRGKSGWLEGIIKNVGDFFGGSSTVIQGQTVSTTQQKSALPAWLMVLITVIGGAIIIYVLMKGFKYAIYITIVVAVLILSLLAYGVFAKNMVITTAGGGGQQTVHGGVLNFMKDWFKNVTLAVAGG